MIPLVYLAPGFPSPLRPMLLVMNAARITGRYRE
ncbi:hypothetical protein SAMN00790413_00790 [Deinococcus hopiensis KR-140]|uniref:Uncharacterized protein n=1 Tax=Deinococcus hopiensis KR-140 TaxID=695939 RepID=A0A1W1VAV5_9DEIO|nr:hypothetical protein SAMN00790413_00790 [Deinococcus hopiensis KR-140]